MPKGTCQAEVMSNSEKIKPVSLAIIKLCLSKDISQQELVFFYFIYLFMITGQSAQLVCPGKRKGITGLGTIIY